MFKEKRNYLFLIPILCGFFFLLLMMTYTSIFLEDIDLGILQFMVRRTSVNISVFFEIITILASWRGILVILILLFVFVKEKRNILAITILTLAAFGASHWFQGFVERSRPAVIQLSNATGFGFPSNHMTLAVVFYGVLIFLVWQKLKNINIKIALTTVLSIHILFIGASRLYLRTNFFTDVLAGALLGGLILSVFCLLYKHITILHTDKPKKSTRRVKKQSQN